MLHDNRSAYIAALIGLNFLWTGIAYIAQAYRPLAFLDGGSVNLITCGAYYVCQAAGVGLAGLLFAKVKAFAFSRAPLILATLLALLCAALSLFLLRGLKPLVAESTHGRSGVNYKFVLLAFCTLIALCAVNAMGFSFPLKAAQGSIKIELTRAFYGVGLVVAGVLSDNNRRWGAICCLASLAFPFAALALGGSATGETLMWIIAYLFLGFLSVYRVLVFSDISRKSNLPALGAFGLLAGRLGEAAGALISGTARGTPFIIIAGLAFALVVALFMALYQKLYASAIRPQDKLMAYAHRYKLTAREREILTLIVQGESNAEIAGTLYIAESTVKFHAGNIFKKTSFVNRSELTADYTLGGH